MASRSRVSAPSVNTSRRTFRGLAGPNDGRLPKSQARRRKASGEQDTPKNKVDDDEADKERTVRNDLAQRESKTKSDSADDAQCSHEAIVDCTNPAQEEIEHLLRRVKNVRESIQLSATANRQPSIWQQNVLHPVRNCVREWRAIVGYYGEDLEPSDLKAPSLKVFELIQLSLQSGPLAGAKPGYFKRCGASAAQQALDFLNSTVPTTEEAASALGFSDKQVNAIEKWRVGAQKAVDSEKPPSKSLLKKQNKAKAKK